MIRKYQQSTYHLNVNLSLIAESIIQIKSGITINVDASVKIKKNIICCKKDYVWNPATCSSENGKY